MNKENICKNLETVRQRIEKACQKSGRNPEEIRLIAVSKTKPEAAILEALNCNQIDFGENRMQELEDKMEHIRQADIQWHMIGTLQSNKIRHIAEKVHWIHSVAKKSHFKEINKRAKQAGRVINTLLQVNISGEEQKGGCRPEEVREILEYAATLTNVKVCGFMGMATFVDNPEDIRHEFQLLKIIFDWHQPLNNGKNIELKHLSMGMSADMEVAIEEGATMVRIGSDIFGSRNYA